MVELPEEVASYDYGLKTAEEAKAEAIGELFFAVKRTELGTLEWITFNPNYLIRISTVETF